MQVSRLFCIVFLLYSYGGFSQSAPNINLKHNSLGDSVAIKNDSLKMFIKDFETITYPFEFEEPPNSGDIINREPLQYLLDVDLEESSHESYYYGYIFYAPSYLGLIITRHYDPGAFGIDNSYVALITLTYDGAIVDHKELSCLCHDTNMGTNDYYATEFKIIVESNKITVHETSIHGTLIEEGNENDFEEINTEVIQFDVSTNGKIA